MSGLHAVGDEPGAMVRLAAAIRDKIPLRGASGHEVEVSCPIGGGSAVLDLQADVLECACDPVHEPERVISALGFLAERVPLRCSEHHMKPGFGCQDCERWTGRMREAEAELRAQPFMRVGSDEDSDTGPPLCPKVAQPGHVSRHCLVCGEREKWVTAESDRRDRDRRLDLLRRSVRDGSGVDDALRRFPLYSASEVADRQVLPDSLPGILGPPGTVTEVTGYRGSGKSLFVHGIAQAAAHGFDEVYGLQLRLHGPALYVAREGVPGWTKRVRAWAAHHGLSDAGEGVRFMHDGIDVTKDTDLAGLSALLVHTQAALLVLDPVAMTGGGSEDEETYQQYRAASLELASEHQIVVILLTNTGHAVRTRGRNSSMLVDGMDASVAMVKDEKTGTVTVTPNKERDMGKVNLFVRFEGAGDKDPDDAERWLSGVMVSVAEDDVRADQIKEDLEALKRSVALAERVLLGCCDCAQGVKGAEDFPDGCPAGGATTAQMAQEMGLDPADRDRSKTVQAALKPVIEQGYVRSVGKTRGQRYHWGRDEEGAKG